MKIKDIWKLVKTNLCFARLHNDAAEASIGLESGHKRYWRRYKQE